MTSAMYTAGLLDDKSDPTTGPSSGLEHQKEHPTLIDTATSSTPVADYQNELLIPPDTTATAADHQNKHLTPPAAAASSIPGVDQQNKHTTPLAATASNIPVVDLTGPSTSTNNKTYQH